MNNVKAFASIAFALCAFVPTHAQSLEDRISALEGKLQTMNEQQKYKPQIHGILRGKYEYQRQ